LALNSTFFQKIKKFSTLPIHLEHNNDSHVRKMVVSSFTHRNSRKFIFVSCSLSHSPTFWSLFSFPYSVRTDLTEVGANSTLSVAKINKFDSGEREMTKDGGGFVI
jgi:hypothetical protein